METLRGKTVKIMCDHGVLDADRLRQSLDNAFALAADAEEDRGRAEAYANLKVVIQYLKTGRLSF